MRSYKFLFGRDYQVGIILLLPYRCPYMFGIQLIKPSSGKVSFFLVISVNLKFEIKKISDVRTSSNDFT